MANLQIQSIFTKVLTNGSFVINEASNITYINVELLAGAATIKGSLKVNGLDSDPVPLQINKPYIASAEGNRLLTGITISFPAGTVEISCQ